MIESEGITESVEAWRTDVPGRFANALGLDRVMFEAADPEVFAWYVKNYGPEVNLFVDHSQIVQLEMPPERDLGDQEPVGEGDQLLGVRA
jgi:phosphosulfolactate synthase (CoM biosynthesis protein A)